MEYIVSLNSKLSVEYKIEINLRKICLFEEYLSLYIFHNIPLLSTFNYLYIIISFTINITQRKFENTTYSFVKFDMPKARPLSLQV